MGASQWSYFVPYQPDFTAALDQLQQQVFRAGGYDGRAKAKTIAELRKRAGEDGTHSILDMTRVGPVPARRGRERLQLGDVRAFEDFKNRFGSVRELHRDDLVEIFGTTKPTRAQVTASLDEVIALRERWVGTIVVVYEGDRPAELLFAGFSGD